MRARDGITWITSLSLDAPLVVVVWQHAIASHFSIPLDPHHRILVFLPVWLGYTADRWLDAWRHEENVSRRHSFHALRRWVLLALWVILLGISIALSLAKLSPTELRNGFVLAMASLVATGFIQLSLPAGQHALLKSALTAALVTWSTLLFATPSGLTSILQTCALMGSLFFLNCLLIHSWDRFIDARQSRNDIRRSTRLAIPLAAVLAMTINLSLLKTNPLAPYAIVSIFLLLSIHVLMKRSHEETKRTLADLVLLTPLWVMI